MKNKILYYIITPISVLVSTLFAMALQPIIDNGIAMDWKAFFKAVCVAVVLCCLDIVLCYFSDYLIDVCKAEFIVKLRIFDECLASLDNITAKAIEKDLLKQNDMGILMITHRIFEENMQMYDCVIVMENGKIIEMGKWKDLKSKSKFVQA